MMKGGGDGCGNCLTGSAVEAGFDLGPKYNSNSRQCWKKKQKLRNISKKLFQQNALSMNGGRTRCVPEAT